MPIINAEGCQLETSYQSLLPIVPSVSCKPASSDDRLRLSIRKHEIEQDSSYLVSKSPTFAFLSLVLRIVRYYRPKTLVGCRAGPIGRETSSCVLSLLKSIEIPCLIQTNSI
jgi:hypothetical protein